MGKLTPEVEKVIVETQKLVLSGFSEKDEQAKVPAWVKVIKQVADMPDELLKSCLGETGKRLKRFAIRANTDHPDLEIFPDLEGADGKPILADLFRSALSRLEKAKVEAEKRVKDNVMSAQALEASGGLYDNEERALLGESYFYPMVMRRLHQPRTRMLCGLQDRNEQRAIKKQVKNIGLKATLSGGEDSFYGHPDHFKRFARNSKFYIEELRAFEERQTCFQKHGMQELSHVFASRMRNLQESIQDTCGFFRIKPDEASVTLARLHGFKWADGHINVPSKYFAPAAFWLEASTESKEEDYAESLKKTVILNTKFAPSGSAVVNFQYQPRMYPLPHFQASLPDMAKAAIDHAEHFALLNGNPFFDYYWVLVPSISLNHPLLSKSKDSWIIKDEFLNPCVFDDQMKAAAELDSRLVKEGYIVPIIIGERDGKCYYLSMWF